MGDVLPDAAGFEQLERTCREVALGTMAKALAAALNADRSDERGTWLACPRRDRRDHRGDGLARHAGRRAKTFVTALGEMELSRAWYHCDACGRGFAPRDRELGFGNGGLSPAVLRMVGCAAGEVSFATAGSLLHELAGLNVDAKTVERHARALGREIAADERERVAAGPPTARTLYLGLDGIGVPVRGAETEGRAGWQPDGSAKTREAKLAVVWSAERTGADGTPARDPGSVTCSAAIESAATRDTDTVPAPFTQRVVREAARRGFGAAERRVVLGDGAAWIWNIAAEHFPGAVEIVDVFHAAEHLFDIAKALYGDDNDLARVWAEQRRDELLAGDFDDLLRAVGTHAGHCEEARKGRAYFADNRRRMDYPRFRALGLCIGSGVVEGAAGTSSPAASSAAACAGRSPAPTPSSHCVPTSSATASTTSGTAAPPQNDLHLTIETYTLRKGCGRDRARFGGDPARLAAMLRPVGAAQVAAFQGGVRLVAAGWCGIGRVARRDRLRGGPERAVALPRDLA